MTDVFLIAALRTPIGKFGGSRCWLATTQLGSPRCAFPAA